MIDTVYNPDNLFLIHNTYIPRFSAVHCLISEEKWPCDSAAMAEQESL